MQRPQRPGSVVPPYAWHGQVNCVVGPFTSRQVAEFFVENIMDTSAFGAPPNCLLQENDTWYIDTRFEQLPAGVVVSISPCDAAERKRSADEAKIGNDQSLRLPPVRSTRRRPDIDK